MKHLLFFLIFVPHFSVAQVLEKVASVPFQAEVFVGIDAYKNIYFIKNRELHKQGPEGNFSFNDLQLGKISSVDILNPLKIVVFYEETNTVVLLDNKLNEIERVNFSALPEFKNVGLAANAGGNTLWIFNLDTRQLGFFDYRTKATVSFSQPVDGSVLGMASNFNYCYLLTDTKLLTYNRYGSLLLQRDAAGVEKIEQSDETVLGLKNNNLLVWPEAALSPLLLKTEGLKIKDLELTSDFLYIYDSEFLHTFKLTLPN